MNFHFICATLCPSLSHCASGNFLRLPLCGVVDPWSCGAVEPCNLRPRCMFSFSSYKLQSTQSECECECECERYRAEASVEHWIALALPTWRCFIMHNVMRICGERESGRRQRDREQETVRKQVWDPCTMRSEFWDRLRRCAAWL